MRRYFNFTRLIRKYIAKLTLDIIKQGYYNEKGDWVVEDKQTITFQGAVISYKESKIYRSSGTLTEKDKRLFALEPIDNALYGSKVVYKGDVYSIADNSDNSEFTGIWAYTLKYVSAFKDARIDIDITDEMLEAEDATDD